MRRTYLELGTGSCMSGNVGVFSKLKLKSSDLGVSEAKFCCTGVATSMIDSASSMGQRRRVRQSCKAQIQHTSSPAATCSLFFRLAGELN